jgi:hypothetical protein
MIECGDYLSKVWPHHLWECKGIELACALEQSDWILHASKTCS